MNKKLSKATSSLMDQLHISNVHAVPRVKQVVINVGVAKHRDDSKFLAVVAQDMKAITGQQPYERKARRAVAGFNVRRGDLVGYCVTLRGMRMHDFGRRFVGVTLPRVRDFRGIPVTSLDGHGNLSIGLTEQLAFPEIHIEKTDVVFGLQVTFATSARTDADGEALFRSLGFPLRESES